MKTNTYEVIKYEADDGKVFDWAEPRYQDTIDENGNKTGEEQIHLYASVLWIGHTDSIENYVEIDAPIEENEQ